MNSGPFPLPLAARTPLKRIDVFDDAMYDIFKSVVQLKIYQNNIFFHKFFFFTSVQFERAL
jgi:hypothetical protein